MGCLPEYAELHCLSNFTFLRGASHPEELVARAVALGYAALALTDECSLAGVVRAHVAAKEHGLKLILGSELALGDGTRLVLLAPDRRAYAALSTLITAGRRRGKKGRYALERADVEAAAAEGLLALLLEGDGRWLAGWFPGRAWIAVELHCGANDRARLDALGAASRASTRQSSWPRASRSPRAAASRSRSCATSIPQSWCRRARRRRAGWRR
jgi:error-prone DNA polymerase